ncbi:Uncharacterised protein [Burkholderia oklahomensis]|nr:Uncharacterised protein [Burkholderia oklahomensis]
MQNGRFGACFAFCDLNFGAQSRFPEFVPLRLPLSPVGSPTRCARVRVYPEVVGVGRAARGGFIVIAAERMSRREKSLGLRQCRFISPSGADCARVERRVASAERASRAYFTSNFHLVSGSRLPTWAYIASSRLDPHPLFAYARLFQLENPRDGARLAVLDVPLGRASWAPDRLATGDRSSKPVCGFRRRHRAAVHCRPLRLSGERRWYARSIRLRRHRRRCRHLRRLRLRFRDCDAPFQDCRKRSTRVRLAGGGAGTPMRAVLRPGAPGHSRPELLIFLGGGP